MMKKLGFVLFSVAALVSQAFGHDFYTSYSRVKVVGTTVEVQFPLNLRDFPDLDAAKAIEANYRVGAPEPASSVVVSRNTIADDVVILEFVYTFQHQVTNLKITSTLDRITQEDHS